MKYKIKIFFLKIMSLLGLISKDKALKRIKFYNDYLVIKKSGLFDVAFYNDIYFDVKIDPIRHYLLSGWIEGRNPSASFSTTAYLNANKDVKDNPLVHYIKIGKKEKRKTEIPFNFPKEAIPVIYQSAENANMNVHKRIAIFASFSGKAIIEDSVVYYLKGLKQIVDKIIFIADNPLLPGEIEKIKDIVCYACCERHGEYDFGSYKRGFLYAKKEGLINDNCEELIIANDSCYGPVYPFSEMFSKMKTSECDFWGLSINPEYKEHIQSFFYCFKKNVLKNDKLGEFLSKVKKENGVLDVIFKYEIELTSALEKEGFKKDSFIPFSEDDKENNKTLYPLTLLKEMRSPLIKVKVFNDGFKGYLEESSDDALDFIKLQNKELYNIIALTLK